VRGLFVTGTDTGVGKTVLSAALMLRFPEAAYWKPIQTGTRNDTADDTAEVRRLSGGRTIDGGIRLPDPVSPHLAAQRAGMTIELPRLDGDAGIRIIEGAGGVLVPINESETMADLMTILGLPVVVATRTSLGTINHTLLTLEALRARKLRIAGVVMIGDSNADNRAAIEHYGNVAVVGEMPRFDLLTRECLGAWAETLPKDLIA
jgi:dethiobiotin synthase